MTIGLITFLENANLAWLMHKRYNPTAKNRRQIIQQYIQRNKHRFDHQATGCVANIGRCSSWNQMKAFDYWYYMVFDEIPFIGATPPSQKFIDGVEANVRRRREHAHTNH